MLIAYTKRGLRRREREFERDKVRRWPLRIAMCAWSAAFAAMLATSAYTAIPATIFTAVMAGLTVACVTAANLLSRKK